MGDGEKRGLKGREEVDVSYVCKRCKEWWGGKGAEKASEGEGIGDAVRKGAKIADIVGPVLFRDGLCMEQGICEDGAEAVADDRVLEFGPRKYRRHYAIRT